MYLTGSEAHFLEKQSCTIPVECVYRNHPGHSEVFVDTQGDETGASTRDAKIDISHPEGNRYKGIFLILLSFITPHTPDLYS